MLLKDSAKSADTFIGPSEALTDSTAVSTTPLNGVTTRLEEHAKAVAYGNATLLCIAFPFMFRKRSHRDIIGIEVFVENVSTQFEKFLPDYVMPQPRAKLNSILPVLSN